VKKIPIIGGLLAAIAAFVLGRRVALREDIDWTDAPRPGALVDIDGYGVHYIDRGEGPAIVLVHGFGGQTYSYRKLIPALARDHRVIAVDLKGYGYSQRDATTDLSHTGQVAMLRKLLRRLGIDRAVLVGHSMGGFVVQRFAATHPEACEAIVLAASVSGDEMGGPRARRLPVARFLLRPLLPILGGITARRLLKYAYYDESQLTDEVREEYIRPTRLKGSMDGLLAMMQQAKNDAPIDYARITMPALLLYGAADRVVPLKAATRLRERIPQARLVVIERAGHLLLEEKGDECERAIRDFLRESGAAQPTASVSAYT
jgi:pimeloyl-ACP methyl ester carboxylesterase